LAFRKQGSSKTRKQTFSKKIIWAHHKKCGVFFVRFFSFFSPSVVWFDFFNRVFGRFVTRGVQKREKKSRETSSAPQKSSYLLTSLFFFPPRGALGQSAIFFVNGAAIACLPLQPDVRTTH
jgi:hypothetical protein